MELVHLLAFYYDRRMVWYTSYTSLSLYEYDIMHVYVRLQCGALYSTVYSIYICKDLNHYYIYYYIISKINVIIDDAM